MSAYPRDAQGLGCRAADGSLPVPGQRPGPPRPALFLDRDGVLIEDIGYRGDAQGLSLLPGAARLIATAEGRGWFAVLVTNQSGIGRGYYGWAGFAAVQAAMERQLAREGARLDLVLACPFHPAARLPYRHSAHPGRKPLPGMLLAAASLLPIDLGRSWIIGDGLRDLAAGKAAGCAGGLLVGQGLGAGALALSGAGYRVLSVPDCAAAAVLLPSL